MSSLPPLRKKETILKNSPWYIRHGKLTVFVGSALGISIFFSRFIYDYFADVPFEFPVHPDIVAQRHSDRNQALDSLHKFLGADPKYVEEYRTKVNIESDNLREIREKKRLLKEELKRLRGEE